MIGEDQRVGNDHVLSPAGSKYNDLGNVFGGERFTALVDFVCGGLVTVEPDDGELGLNLTRIDLNDSDASSNELAAQGISETADSSLGSAVDTATRIRLTASNRTNVDDISGAAIGALV